MVAHGADAAEPLHHDRHFPVRAALDEFLEATEFDDVQAHLVHLVVIVEQDRDLAMALDPRHGIDGDAALAARYGPRVPVLRRDDGAELDWPFDADAVRRFMAPL